MIVVVSTTVIKEICPIVARSMRLQRSNVKNQSSTIRLKTLAWHWTTNSKKRLLLFVLYETGRKESWKLYLFCLRSDLSNKRLSDETKTKIIEPFGNNPIMSQRKASLKLERSQSSICRTLYSSGITPWKFAIWQELFSADFCEDILPVS